MRIVEQHSHLNGWEHILVHNPGVWTDIQDIIGAIDVEKADVTEPGENGMAGRQLYLPTQQFRERFEAAFLARKWRETSRTYGLMPGAGPIHSQTRTDIGKDRIAAGLQIGTYSFGPYDLFANHMAFYVGDVIDVGVEILPMKEMSNEMSSVISHFEGAVHSVIQQGRGVPAVPLVLVGIAP